MRLLAVDPSSAVLGMAYFEDATAKPQTAALHLNRDPDRSWLERMELMAKTVEDRSILWAPDVIAIEDVVVWASAGTALMLGKTWGYLVRVLTVEYRKAEWIAINTATIRVALDLSSHAKRADRQRAARAMFPGLATQDEADAAAVGFTAYQVIGKLRAESGIA